VRARRLAIAAGIGAVSVAALTLLRGRRNGRPGTRRLRLERGLAAVRLAARGGARYATSAPRLFASAGEHREALRNDLALQTAEDVAATLGTMKGVLMKLGQMASYINEGLTPAARRTLSRLQDSARPMSPDLAAQVIAEELGLPPDRAFAAWDPEPIAAASIGQVHRAITHNGRAVAVKVQYPGIAEAIEADLGNVALLRRMLRVIAPSQDADALLAELRDRITQELDYRAEARSQQLFAHFYAGHPTIHVPGVVGQLSARRVLTSELAGGARFAELAGWPQAERDLAAETIYRFVFRSLYQAHTSSTATHIRATTCSMAAARSRFWTSGWSSATPRTSCGRWSTWSAACASTMIPRRSAGPTRTPACCYPARRCPPRPSSSRWPSSTTRSANQDRAP